MEDKLNTTLSENEERFEIRPIGIRYKCPYCHEGEMKSIIGEESLIKIKNDGKINNPLLFRHICTKCNKTLLLPKQYPYIEWEKND